MRDIISDRFNNYSYLGPVCTFWDIGLRKLTVAEIAFQGHSRSSRRHDSRDTRFPIPIQ